MQQLFGDKTRDTNSAFLRELFLQRLPSNVRMVLASTPDMGSLDNLAQLADKIMEVATSYPAIVAVSTTSELEHLRKKVAKLKSMCYKPSSLLNNQVLGDLPAHIGNRKSSVGTIISMVIMHRNANPHARSRVTLRLRAEGDRRS